MYNRLLCQTRLLVFEIQLHNAYIIVNYLVIYYYSKNCHPRIGEKKSPEIKSSWEVEKKVGTLMRESD